MYKYTPMVGIFFIVISENDCFMLLLSKFDSNKSDLFSESKSNIDDIAIKPFFKQFSGTI